MQPSRGAGDLQDVLEELASLADRVCEVGDPERPFLEVFVRLHVPDPHLRGRIDAALEGKQARLLKITREQTGNQLGLAEAVPRADLRDLNPEEVFVRRYQHSYQGQPNAELMAAFRDVYRQALEVEP